MEIKVIGLGQSISHFDEYRVELRVDGELPTYSEIDEQLQRIINALRTFRGERAVFPNYGSRIYLLIGENYSPESEALLRFYVKEAISSLPEFRNNDPVKRIEIETWERQYIKCKIYLDLNNKEFVVPIELRGYSEQ